MHAFCVASLLVYVEAHRLDEILPTLVAGETWQIQPGAFTEPQLERLDEHSWLFVVSGTRCVAVLRNPRITNGVFAGGPALVTHHDIAHVLPRLGCTGDAARWAATPRILPPSDLDLLRYTLGVSDDEPIDPILPDDDRTRELRAAVWDDPTAHEARSVYADHLLDRGDPRGELVSMQLLRGGDFPSERERSLVRRIARDLAEPLTPYLAPDFALDRGFVARCTVNDLPMPTEILWHRAWRTVESLSTTNLDLLTSPHVRARRVGVSGLALPRLVEHARPLPFETIVGIAPIGKPQRGVWMADWTHVMHEVGALANVRTLSIGPTPASIFTNLARSPLGRRLRHLDMYVELASAEPQQWATVFEEAAVPLLTLRFVPDPRARWLGPEVLVALRDGQRNPMIVVQVEAALEVEAARAVTRVVAQLARNVRRAELHDLAGPIERQVALIAQLRPLFRELDLAPRERAPLAP